MSGVGSLIIIAVLLVVVIIGWMLLARRGWNEASFLTPFANQLYQYTGLLVLLGFCLSLNVAQSTEVGQAWFLMIMGLVLFGVAVFVGVKRDLRYQMVVAALALALTLSAQMVTFKENRGWVSLVLMVVLAALVGVLAVTTPGNYMPTTQQVVYGTMCGLLFSFLMQFRSFVLSSDEENDPWLKTGSALLFLVSVGFALLCFFINRQK